MKTCKACNKEKPYEPAAARHTKLSGFHGAVCWDCYKAAQRVAPVGAVLESSARICVVCQQAKPYDRTKPAHSSASGFHGASCWSCYKAAQRLRAQKARNKYFDPACLEPEELAALSKRQADEVAKELAERRRQRELAEAARRTPVLEAKYQAWVTRECNK